MPQSTPELGGSAVPVYQSAPPDNTFITADSNGNVTLTFQPVDSAQVWTGTITIITSTGQALQGTTWTISRDNTTPFLTWYDNQVAIDIQGRDGQQITVAGTGLVPGTQVRAVWAGRNDAVSAGVPIVSPWVSGSPNGVSLVRGAQVLGQQAGSGMPVGNTVILQNTTVIQPSYEAFFTLNLPQALGTVPFANLIFFWIDPQTGATVDVEWFNITAGNGPTNQITTYLSGPARSGTLQVQFVNGDPAVAMTLTWAIWQTGQVYTRDRLLQPFYATSLAPVGYTNPNGIPANGLLAIVSPNVGPGAQSTRLLAAWNGKAMISIDARGQANNISFDLEDPATIYSSSVNGIIWSVDTPAGGGFVTQEIGLPNGPVQLREINRGSTGNAQPTVTIVKEEY